MISGLVLVNARRRQPVVMHFFYGPVLRDKYFPVTGTLQCVGTGTSASFLCVLTFILVFMFRYMTAKPCTSDSLPGQHGPTSLPTP